MRDNLLAQRRVLNFWGISYDACSANPASAYTRRQLRANADYVYAVWPGMKLSASLYVNYTDATRMGDPAYLEGQRPPTSWPGRGWRWSMTRATSSRNLRGACTCRCGR